MANLLIPLYQLYQSNYLTKTHRTERLVAKQTQLLFVDELIQPARAAIRMLVIANGHHSPHSKSGTCHQYRRNTAVPEKKILRNEAKIGAREVADDWSFAAYLGADNPGDLVCDSRVERHPQTAASRGCDHRPRLFWQTAERCAERDTRTATGNFSADLCGRNLAHAPLRDRSRLCLRDLRDPQPGAFLCEESAASFAGRGDLRRRVHRRRARAGLGHADTSQAPPGRARIARLIRRDSARTVSKFSGTTSSSRISMSKVSSKKVTMLMIPCESSRPRWNSESPAFRSRIFRAVGSCSRNSRTALSMVSIGVSSGLRDARRFRADRGDRLCHCS